MYVHICLCVNECMNNELMKCCVDATDKYLSVQGRPTINQVVVELENLQSYSLWKFETP